MSDKELATAVQAAFYALTARAFGQEVAIRDARGLLEAANHAAEQLDTPLARAWRVFGEIDPSYEQRSKAALLEAAHQAHLVMVAEVAE